MRKRVLIPVGNDYEDLELWYPRMRLGEAGIEVIMTGAEKGTVYHGKYGYPCQADLSFVDVKPEDLAGIVIPGGWMPDKLRRDSVLLDIVRTLAGSRRIVAAICHGGWIPISAGVYKGVRVTGSLGIKDDLINAGGKWEDSPVVVDGHFVSSRKPDDLPLFCQALLKSLHAA